MSDNKPFKLNLLALKNTTENIKSVETLDKKEKNIKNTKKITPIYKKEIESPLNNILKKEDSEPINKTHNLDLSKMKNRKDNKINEKKEHLIKNIDKIKVDEKKEEIGEVFSNYESEFNKNKKTVLERIQKFKNFVKPKTRLGFVSLLIGLTIFGIFSLFIIAPDKHNLENYKVNFLLVKSNLECKIDDSKCQKKENKIEIIKKEITQVDNKTLKKEIFVIEYKTKVINGKKIIIYNGQIFNTQQDFNKKIKEIIKKKKLEKLKEFLLKNKEKKM